MNLTKEDYDILIQALDSWKNESISNGLIGGMLGMMLTPNIEKGKANLESMMIESNLKTKERDEIATCLKTKLILLKNRQ